MFDSLLPAKRTRAEGEPYALLQRSVNDLFDRFGRGFLWSPFGMPDEPAAGYMPRMDVAETEKEYEVTAELPGLEPRDFTVELTGDLLTIKGHKQQEKEDKKKDHYRMERSYGSFQRALRLPPGVDSDKIRASFKNGVLTLKLPKTADAKSKAKAVPVEAV